jgi:hypothetical protein
MGTGFCPVHTDGVFMMSCHVSVCVHLRFWTLHIDYCFCMGETWKEIRESGERECLWERGRERCQYFSVNDDLISTFLLWKFTDVLTSGVEKWGRPYCVFSVSLKEMMNSNVNLWFGNGSTVWKMYEETWKYSLTCYSKWIYIPILYSLLLTFRVLYINSTVL